MFELSFPEFLCGNCNWMSHVQVERNIKEFARTNGILKLPFTTWMQIHVYLYMYTHVHACSCIAMVGIYKYCLTWSEELNCQRHSNFECVPYTLSNFILH